jgi:hypothetical protein
LCRGPKNAILDVLIDVASEVACIEVVRAADASGRPLARELADCIVHKVGLPIPSVAAPGQPDLVLAVRWSVPCSRVATSGVAGAP